MKGRLKGAAFLFAFLCSSYNFSIPINKSKRNGNAKVTAKQALWAILVTPYMQAIPTDFSTPEKK